MYEYEKKNLQILRSSLAECTVLLKNNGDFPLKEAGKLAVYGNGVRKTIKGGTGSGEVNSRFFIKVEQGLKDAGFELTTQKWLDAYDAVCVEAKKKYLADLKAEAKASGKNKLFFGLGRSMPEPEYDLPLDGEGDTAVYVLSRISGEGSDRSPAPGDIKPTATETRDILALNEKYAKFMLVINAGGVVDLQDLRQVKNILVLSQLGVETGAALADILLGKQNPSGKLATTWSAWEDYAPMEDFATRDESRYKEGIYVGYRYFDAQNKKALYPFGYGLSYTTFQIDQVGAAVDADKITVTATVTNTGAMAGKEVVQVYVSAPAGKLDKPYQDLAGFVKTAALAPGASQTVSVSFSLKDLASYDEETAAYILEKGNYIIRVGNSSADTQVAAVAALAETVTVLQARNACGKPDFTDWKPENPIIHEIAGDVPVLTVDPAAFITAAVTYDVEYPVDPLVAGLTDKQLIYGNIGHITSSMNVIGQASSRVAGAAGESTNALEALGVPVIVMADGPAGVRVSRQFYRDKKGVHPLSQGMLPESMADMMSPMLKLMLRLAAGRSKPPKNAKIEDQYATAIPIGTALAQSWNLEFAQQCGDIVGGEMERFGVHLWLAPAMNIHRSIRCGRNFEYFSEDPLISGKMAAAITLGVQAHPGCGVTIKHFAVNNQETNRYGNNSQVSERALREIYLKGYGICVREAQPKSVMTSYNLLNGTHTAERWDLCEDILRCEYGFAGIIMTDWVIGGGLMGSKENAHRVELAQYVAAAGGDLFMPGCKADFKNMEQGLKEGVLTRKQLEINVTRVYRMAKELTGK